MVRPPVTNKRNTFVTSLLESSKTQMWSMLPAHGVKQTVESKLKRHETRTVESKLNREETRTIESKLYRLETKRDERVRGMRG
ncbi:hypothetical protein TNCT_402401 [Trichonephila clavata]|uniref:Uncharacterized protein n=1 Tax=Trichonephila clavata TaxID=2740835 RepID=A0A8X6H8G8_TRICU|nr:hypothetical protein TNCT_402401 [Trichonephila clavata]